MVTVSSATPSGPTVFPLSQCGSGTDNTITLGCYATGFTPSSLTYAWTKEGTALTNSIQYPPVQKNSLYSGISQIQVSKQDWDAMKTFQCAVTHSAGSGQANFQKTKLHYQMPNISVSASSPSDDKSEASFSCFAKDFSPKDHKLTWLKDNADITNKIYEVTTPVQGREENGYTVYSAASFLSVPSDGLNKDTRFTCLFEGKGEGGIKTYVNESVTYGCPTISCSGGDVDITIIGPTNQDMFISGNGKIHCQVQENKPSVTSVLWQDENGHTLIEYSKSTDNGKKVINLALDITYNEWNQGIKRYCVVEHSEWLEPVKKIYERSIGGQTQRPSVFMMPPVEHTRKEMVTLTCFVKDFFPQEVYVSWLVDDEEVDSTYEFHTTNAVESYGSYSAYSQLLLSLQQWKRNDVVYSCVVHHESVDNTTKAIVRSIGYRTFEKNTNLVNLNMNVPNTCKPQ
ncbi:Ig mu chain C region membrane-bound form [Larimichthys crocea]|uniref:Ig mu chain C region membrane-bound form n=1 Tax=Larimichthys crocea TaxID=215358 RepID=A0A6G0HVM6_LARCR|nr:Ig mu chain C region membrane-bound form [Larimichthys crocea]